MHVRWPLSFHFTIRTSFTNIALCPHLPPPNWFVIPSLFVVKRGFEIAVKAAPTHKSTPKSWSNRGIKHLPSSNQNSTKRCTQNSAKRSNCGTKHFSSNPSLELRTPNSYRYLGNNQCIEVVNLGRTLKLSKNFEFEDFEDTTPGITSAVSPTERHGVTFMTRQEIQSVLQSVIGFVSDMFRFHMFLKI